MRALTLPVGIVLGLHTPRHRWGEPIWRAFAVLAGTAGAEAGSALGAGLLFAGQFELQIERATASLVGANLRSGAPAIWVAVADAASTAPRVVAVTADPDAGEALATDCFLAVEALEMPEALRAPIASFVTNHGAERPFLKRQRAAWRPERSEP